MTQSCTILCNSHGVCGGPSVPCYCDTNYSGEYCETQIISVITKGFMIAAIVFGSLMGLAGIVMLFCYLCSLNDKKSKDDDSMAGMEFGIIFYFTCRGFFVCLGIGVVLGVIAIITFYGNI